jgi:hypothetical protein
MEDLQDSVRRGGTKNTTTRISRVSRMVREDTRLRDLALPVLAALGLTAFEGSSLMTGSLKEKPSGKARVLKKLPGNQVPG